MSSWRSNAAFLAFLAVLGCPGCETYRAECTSPMGSASVTMQRILVASATTATDICGATLAHSSDPQSQAIQEAIELGMRLGRATPAVGP